MADDDIFARQASLARRQKLLDAMTQSNAQTPIQGKYGVGQLLAKLGTTFLLSSAGKDQDAATAQASKDYSAGLGAELSRYMDRHNGRPGQTLSDDQAASLMFDNQDPGPLADGQKADPRGAVVAALTSRFPEMQGLGKAEFPTLMKQEAPLSQKDILGLSGYDPKSRLAAALSGGDLRQLTPEKKFMNVDGRVVDERDPTQIAADYREKYGDTTVINGDLYQRDSRGKLIKLDNAPKVSVQTNVNNSLAKGENSFLEALGKDQAGAYKAARTAAESGYQLKGAVAQMKELDSQGIMSGPMAKPGMAIGAFAQSLGLPVDQTKLANSEAYQQQVGQQVSNLLKNSSVGRSMTDKDMELFISSLPTMLQSPAGRQQVYRQIESMADNDIRRHQTMQSALEAKYPEYKGILTLNPVDSQTPPIRPPQTPAVPAAPGKAPSVSNW